MSTTTRNIALSAAVVLSLAVVSSAAASQPKALLLPPSHDHCFDLPKFGFSSFNIRGFGEQVTNVRWGGRAARMGLEPGDIITTGTPSGVGMGMSPQRWLKAGDVMECEIEGIGVLRNPVG